VSSPLPDSSTVPGARRIQTRRRLCHDSTVRRGLVLAVVVLVAAASAGAATGKTVRLGAKANGTRVTLVRGDRLVVRLASNPTTGYNWMLVDVTRSVLRPTASTYKGTGRLPGSGGFQTMVFRALSRGTTQVRLAYVQSGSQNVGKRFRLTVVVR
jgi:inhibitor of cysteine peptidase